MNYRNTIIQGHVLDVLQDLPANIVDCIITSPPYWMARDYETKPIIWDGDPDCDHQWSYYIQKGQTGGTRSKKVKVKDKENFQIFEDKEFAFCDRCGAWLGSLGFEPTPELFSKHLCDIFDACRKTLKSTGTLFVNIGDVYGGTGAGQEKSPKPDKCKLTDGQYFAQAKAYRLKAEATKDYPKSLIQAPFMFALEMIARGWTCRNTIIWHKPNAMPSSIKDRFTVDFEYVFFFTQQEQYDFVQQFEPLRMPNAKTVNAPQKHEGYGNPTYSGFEYDATKHTQGRNKRCVWSINTKGSPLKHFACVDKETEVLSLSGWKKYNEIKKGEIIASLDMDKERLTWDIVKDIYVHDYNYNLIQLGNNILQHRVTPNHRMVVKNYLAKRGEWSKYKIKRADSLTSYDRFPVSSEWEEGSYGLDPNEPNPDICELLGWIASDGHYNKYNICITQSLTANRSKCERIEHLLNIANIKYRKTIRNRVCQFNDKEYQAANFSINWEHSKIFRKYLPNKKITWNLGLWSKEGIKRFLNGFIGGDGHIRKDDKRISISQKDESNTDLLQYLAFRTGYCVIKSKRKKYEKSNEGYTLFLTKRKNVSLRKTGCSKLNVKNIKYKGVVWCPETHNGTFVARRNGRILITGNSFPSELLITPIKAGSKRGDLVLDPFMGIGTTAMVAKELERDYLGIELSQKYIDMAHERFAMKGTLQTMYGKNITKLFKKRKKKC